MCSNRTCYTLRVLKEVCHIHFLSESHRIVYIEEKKKRSPGINCKKQKSESKVKRSKYSKKNKNKNVVALVKKL